MKSVVNKKSSRVSRRIEGFSLVELLVVIGIIAIVAAILVPVFASVKEKGRQATSITNLEKIGSAMALFKLDKGTYPDVLFGYARDPATGITNSMIDGLAYAKSQHDAHKYFPGLYPTYINDPNVFTDPDNPSEVSSTDIAVISAYDLYTSGIYTGQIKGADQFYANLYRADAFDSSPRVLGPNSIDETDPLFGNSRRYLKSWTDLVTTNLSSSDPALLSSPDFKRQLRLPTALGDTYVTCTTYHVKQSGKVLVLFLDGHAHTFDASRLLATGPDDYMGAVVNGEVPANFWKMKPNSP